MSNIIDFLQTNPLYAAGMMILVVIFVISLVKKAITFIVIALLLNLGFGYFIYDAANDAIARASNAAGSAVESAGDLFK